MNTFEESLDQELAEGWRPEEGDKIIGKIVNMTKGWSDYQQQYYPIIVVHDEVTDRDVSVHAFHTALARRLIALKPRVGDRIGIKMGPKVPLKGNPKQSVQTYTCRVEGKQEDIWADIQDPRAVTDRSRGPAVPASEAPIPDDDIPF